MEEATQIPSVAGETSSPHIKCHLSEEAWKTREGDMTLLIQPRVPVTQDSGDKAPRTAEATPGLLGIRPENVALVHVTRAGRPIVILLVTPGISHLPCPR